MSTEVFGWCDGTLVLFDHMRTLCRRAEPWDVEDGEWLAWAVDGSVVSLTVDAKRRVTGTVTSQDGSDSLAAVFRSDLQRSGRCGTELLERMTLDELKFCIETQVERETW